MADLKQPLVSDNAKNTMKRIGGAMLVAGVTAAVKEGLDQLKAMDFMKEAPTVAE